MLTKNPTPVRGGNTWRVRPGRSAWWHRGRRAHLADLDRDARSHVRLEVSSTPAHPADRDDDRNGQDHDGQSEGQVYPPLLDQDGYELA